MAGASAPPCDDEARPNPYQKYGPKGAYETRQVMYSTRPGGPKNPGFYVRVDMPGVPNDGIKVVKSSDKHTVNFTGKAPMLWPDVDTSDRVYAGYVALDRDPADVDMKVVFKDGCLRLFFPKCEAGSLHFLPGNADVGCGDEQQVVHDEDTVRILGKLGESYITFVEHAPDSQEITLRGGRPEHINPFLLSGVQCTYEHKVVHLGGEEQLIYVRLDTPDAHDKMYFLGECGGPINFSGDSVGSCSPFDARGRGYIGHLKPKCSCCMYEVIRHDYKHGVIRFLARKARMTENQLPPHNMYILKASRPGEAPKPTTIGLDDELPSDLHVLPSLLT